MTEEDREERREDRREDREERREERQEEREDEQAREVRVQGRRDPERRLDVVTALITSLNDVITTLRLEIKILGDGERNGRTRTYVGMVVLCGLFGLSFFQMRANHDRTADIERVVKFIESCQNPAGECAQRNQRQLAEAIRSISVGVFDSVGCVLATPPEERTDATTSTCRDRHFPK